VGLRKTGCDGRSHLAQDVKWWQAVVDTVMNLQVS
jgi:hypothetical protein